MTLLAATARRHPDVGSAPAAQSLPAEGDCDG